MGRVYFRSDYRSWCIDFKDALGRRRREKAGPTKRVAEVLLRHKEEVVALEKAGQTKPIRDVSFDGFSDDFLRWIKVHRSAGTLRCYGPILKRLRERFKGRFLSEIHRRDIELYATERIEQGSQPASANRDLACLKSLFSRAIEWCNASANPVKGIPAFREYNRRDRFLTDEERKKLLESCHGYLRDVVVLAIHTGMRKGELLSLKWDDIDLANRQIRVTHTKNGEMRFVPMSDGALQCLQSIRKQAETPYLFPGPAGGHLLDVKTAWQSAIGRSGVQNFRFHDLRHTAASYLAMSEVPLQVIQQILGHKTFSQVLRYAHLSQDYKSKAIRKLDEFLSKKR
jgi:integrase